MRSNYFTRTALALLLAVLLVGCQDLNVRQPDGETSLAAAALVRRDLATGATLNGANGMYFGPDGNLYVAVFARGEIVALNPRNGKIVARYGRDQGVLAPTTSPSARTAPCTGPTSSSARSVAWRRTVR